MTYLDANVIIRLLEGDAQTRAALSGQLQTVPGGFMTSELSLIECRCRPLKLADVPLLKLYDEFFAAGDLRLVSVDRGVIDRATDLRASTRLRTPDALHLATALLQNAARFCTGDLHFKGISLMTVEIL